MSTEHQAAGERLPTNDFPTTLIKFLRDSRSRRGFCSISASVTSTRTKSRLPSISLSPSSWGKIHDRNDELNLQPSRPAWKSSYASTWTWFVVDRVTNPFSELLPHSSLSLYRRLRRLRNPRNRTISQGISRSDHVASKGRFHSDRILLDAFSATPPDEWEGTVHP